MQKTFIGEVLKSEINEFTGSTGEQIETWNLTLQLTEDKGITFNVSTRDNMYSVVKEILPGQNVRVSADPVVRADGRIKYKLLTCEVVDNDE